MNTLQFLHLSKMQLCVLLSFFSLLHIQGRTIQQVPAYACIGDSVDIVCSVSVPDSVSNTFLSPQIAFIIDDSENFAAVLTVNVGTDFEGFDLTRLTATADMQTFTVISGNLTILSFMMGDGGLIFGCGQTYFLSGNSPPTASVNVTLELQSVVLPLALSSPPTHSIISFDQSTCSASVNISWTLPNQLEASTGVTYVVYLNGSEIARTMLDSTLHVSTLSASTEYNYSVAAENCVGTTSQVFAATLLTPEFPALTSATHSLLSFNQSTCSASVNVSWTLPNQQSVSSGVEYVVYLNGAEIDRTLLGYYLHVSTLLPTSEYNYSVAASNCIGTSPPVYAPSLLTPVSLPTLSLQSYISNFNTTTCRAGISLKWNTPPNFSKGKKYFLYEAGSLLSTTTATSHNYSTTLLLNNPISYMLKGVNCLGNSTSSIITSPLASYSLMPSAPAVCITYNNTGGLIVNWELSTPTQPSGVSGLDISYSLQLLYSHSRQDVTYTYTDSTNFTLPSSQLSYNTVLTAHNFAQLDGVETNITANLIIVQQCGQSFSEIAMECSFNSMSTPLTTLRPTTPQPTLSLATVNVPVIIGGVLGGFFGLILICVLCWSLFAFCVFCCCLCINKRRNKEYQQAKNEEEVITEVKNLEPEKEYIELSKEDPTQLT